jgi:hypothetical protein
MASWRGKPRIDAIMARLPAAMKAAAKAQLETETTGMVDAMQRACPVGVGLEAHPGALRESIHAYDARRRELLKTIIVDAKDEKGNFIAPHVEFGHLTRGGGRHVPAEPFFFPTWRSRRPGMKRRMTTAGRIAAKRVAGDLIES